MWASLQATVPAGLDHEVIFVDDGSTDGTREWLARLAGPRIKLLLNPVNLGFAAANNRAAAVATGDFLVFLNNDLVLEPGWLEPMLAAAGRPGTGFVGNRQYSTVTGALDHRGVYFDVLGRPLHDRRGWRPTALRACSRYPAVTAACCAIAAGVFRQHGGFDPDFRNGYEDIDLCLRLGRCGYRHYVANRSRVRHHVSASPGRHADETPNWRRFHARWGPPPTARLSGQAYLRRYWRRPWRFNVAKLILALARLLTGHRCERLAAQLRLPPDLALDLSNPPVAPAR